MAFSTLRYALSSQGIATVTFDEPGSPVNTMKPEWQADMLALADQLTADQAALKGVLLTSAKTTFFAGADLKGVLKLKASDIAATYVGIEAVKKAFRRIETLGKPVVALLQGAALGGGWEVALIAHARFALDQPNITFGLPEVSLGLIPGATGITKMSRLLGLMAAQPYLMEGKLFNPAQAVSLGLVDGLASTPEALMAMALAYIHDHPEAQQAWDRKGYKMPGGSINNSPALVNGLAVAPAMLFKKTHGLYPAPQAVLEAMVEGAQVDYDTATRIESRKLAKLMVSQTTKNMITAFFFNLNAIKAGQSRPSGFERYRPAKVGIVGAGLIAADIALASAKKSIPCLVMDVNLEKAKQAQVHPLIHATDKVSDLQGCDLVIEAVMADRGVFASTTPSLPINGLAQASTKPAQFVDLHLFSPVDPMRLVEIIKGVQTDDETLARAYDYVLAIGKTPIVVNESRGFFTSRVLGTYGMEGAAMLEEGIPAALIEHAALAAGMPLGPLAVMDETSLSLLVHEFKRSGRAAGSGFYDYPIDSPKRLWSGLKQHFEKPLQADPQVLQSALQQRLLYRQSVETARCLQENVLTSAHDANIGSIFGVGFPAWTGGALQYVFSEGLEVFLANCQTLAQRHGKGFELSPDVVDCLKKHAP